MWALDSRSARVVQTLVKNGTTFHADVWREGRYTCMGIVYAKMFYGGMASPLNTKLDSRFLVLVFSSQLNF